MSVLERRLIRETSFGLTAKVWQINWVFVLLLCALAAVGYCALYSAGGGPEPYASRHALRFAFGLVLMLCIALVDIRFHARLYQNCNRKHLQRQIAMLRDAVAPLIRLLASDTGELQRAQDEHRLLAKYYRSGDADQ